MEKASLPTSTLLSSNLSGKGVWMNKFQLCLTAGFLLWLWYSNILSVAYHACCGLREPKGPIEWKKCDDIIECGRLEVPLDYFNPSAGVASLALAKYPATNTVEPKLGTLFLNPGGPGGSGVSFVYRIGHNISQLLDGRYDIVSWDPRGINKTLPRIECFATQTEQDIFYAHTAQESGLYLANASDPAERSSFVQQLQLEDARNRALIELCVDRTGEEALSHVGTSTVVRDLERLSTVIEGPEVPVNFWGFSYGTIVGSYFVNMFPERVGRVAIDGVVDPVLWSHSHPMTWNALDLSSSEAVLTGFLDSCTQAGPSLCPIAPGSNNSLDLRGTLDGLLQELSERPLPVPRAKRPGVLTAGQLRDLLFTHMYRPRSWPELASMLKSLLDGNGAPILDFVQNSVELNTTIPAQTAFAIAAIQCVDAAPYSANQSSLWMEEAMDSVEKGLETSSHFGSMNAPDVCPHWPVREAEFFDGPFNHTLANDILVIGNTHDPITPLPNAKTVHHLLPQSVLVQHDGFGHCSLAQTSLCTARIVKEYFLNGVLPEEKEVFCRVGEPIFKAEEEEDGGVWVQRERAQEGFDVRGEAEEVGEEERRLVEIVRGLGRDWEEFGKAGRGLAGRR